MGLTGGGGFGRIPIDLVKMEQTMFVSQKCQYAVRATFELAKRHGDGPVRIADIAEAQDIPIRFLEVILNQLKQGGFVVSQRGSAGGYTLAKNPDILTVGEIIRFVEGPLGPVACVSADSAPANCPVLEDCVFFPLWKRVRAAMEDIYDSTTFKDLVDQATRRDETYIPSYSI